MTEPSPFILTSDAARICGVSADTIRLWVRQGRLAARRTETGVHLFDRRDVERLVQTRQGPESSR